MIRYLGFFVLLVMIALPSYAFAAAEVGKQIPHALNLKDQKNKLRSFEELHGEKGTVIVFVRSVDWCPYCQAQLIDLRDSAEKITDLGYTIVTVSYDRPEVLAKFSRKHNFSHTMLSDEGSVAIKAFGILNEEFNPDHFAYGVPHPYIYVVGNDKVIRVILSEEGYKNRPQVDAIVGALK